MGNGAEENDDTVTERPEKVVENGNEKVSKTIGRRRKQQAGTEKEGNNSP